MLVFERFQKLFRPRPQILNQLKPSEEKKKNNISSLLLCVSADKD